jgi:hypothetical protein
MVPESIDTVAVIVDIVGSRRLENRSEAQEAITEAFHQANAFAPGIAEITATIGDEFQGLYQTTSDALTAWTLGSLLLPEAVDVRCGMGVGKVTRIDLGGSQQLQDGPAWWNARAAVDEAHRRQYAGDTSARTHFIGTSHEPDINAYLLLRDHIVYRMKKRERRLTAALIMGATQSEMAKSEKLSQATISESLHRSGGMALHNSLITFSKANK